MADQLELINRTDIPLSFGVYREDSGTIVEVSIKEKQNVSMVQDFCNEFNTPPAPFIKWREYAKEKPSPGQYCIVWFCSKATAATYGRAGASIQDKFYSYQTCVLLPDIAYWIEYTDIPGPS